MGLVSVEDVLEQIVGEIEDEYDWESPPGLRVGERTLVLDARISIRDLENQYDIELPRDQGFETLAGFVLAQVGHIPQSGESFLYDGRRLRCWRWITIAWRGSSSKNSTKNRTWKARCEACCRAGH